ncbi:MAG: hypothetical protein LBU05_02585, partial [Bifidobacteriaceae bacterium]|nr:hypothetical protein [Bifidobacteriaceae bacterium]
MRRVLGRKLRRDLGRHWRQFFAVALMAALSSLCYIGLEGAWHGLEVSLDRFAADTDLADAWVQGRAIDQDQLEQIRALPGVVDADAARQVWAEDVSSERRYMRLEAVPSGSLSRPQIVEGEPLTDDAAGGVWIDPAYAQANDIAVGDEVKLQVSGETLRLTVRGLALSPEEVYFTGTPALGAPEPDHYGYGYTTTDTLGASAPANLVRVAGQTDAVADAAPAILGGDYVAVQTRASRASVATAFDRVAQIKNLSYLFSGLFILLALLAMFTAIRRLVAMQRPEIAALQALGFSKRQIQSHYLAFGLVTGGAGTVLGAAAAPGISLFVLETQKTMFALPDWSIAYTPLAAAVAALIITACAASALFALAAPLQLNPAEGLRQSIGRARHVAAERAGAIWGRLGPAARWALRDALLSRVRFAMGIVSVVGCMMLLFAGFGVSDSMYNQVEQVFNVERSHTQRIALAAGADGLPEGTQLLQDVAVRL